jgi:hypothetical protein
VKRANKKLEHFRNLGNLEPEAKLKLIQAVRRIEHQLALIDESAKKIREALLLVYYFGSFFILLVPVILWLCKTGGESFRSWESLGKSYNFVLLIMVGLLLPAALYVVLKGTMFKSRVRAGDIVVSFVALPGIVLLSYSLFPGRVVTSTERLILGRSSMGSIEDYVAAVRIGELTGVSFWLFASLVMLTFVFLSIRTNRRKYKECPDALLVDRLIKLLFIADQRPKWWTSLDAKREMLSTLEEAAICFERFIPRRLRTGDFSSDTWVKETSAQIAAALRSLKKWIVTPKTDTNERFVARIASTLQNSVGGDWDSLERIDPEKVPELRLLRFRARAFLRTIFISALPLSLVLIVQKTPLALSDSLVGYAKVGGLLWAAIALLSVLDPLYESRMKDLTQFIPFLGKKKE